MPQSCENRVLDEGLRDEVLESLSLGDVRKVRVLFQSVLSSSGAVCLADQLIRPVMERLGNHWLIGVIDVYHELWHPQEMLRSLRRSLKMEGQLVLVEYRKEDPSIAIALTHRMSVAGARAEVEAEGFTFHRLIAGLPRQHIMVFRR
jgi:hypothetical protein